jgi:hypothetical protein
VGQDHRGCVALPAEPPELVVDGRHHMLRNYSTEK